VPTAGTEDDFRRNEFTQLAEILAHWKACFYCFEGKDHTKASGCECNQTNG
jgi:hypothetical protein